MHSVLGIRSDTSDDEAELPPEANQARHIWSIGELIEARDVSMSQLCT